MELNQCLSILAKASSDNEKMAAMLVAAKLVKSGDIGDEGRRKVFSAVGFDFLNRLLATKDPPEGCSDNPYHSIAVTVLACFTTDQELALHPQVTSKIPVFNGFISNCTENMSTAEDALQCLQGISNSCTGCRHLLRPGYSTLQALVKCYCSQTTISTQSIDLVLHILGQSDVRSMEEFPAHLSTLLALIATEFRANQDTLKFKLCDLLKTILLCCEDSLKLGVRGTTEWLGDIAFGLKDILTSKLDSTHRDPALHLSALLCQMFGLQWLAATGSQFLLLLVDLFKVETHLAIDGRELPEICQSSELLCSCFMVFESTITLMLGNTKDQRSSQCIPLCEEDLLQLHTTLTEAFTFILLLFQQFESSLSPSVTSTSASSFDSLPQDTTPLLIACVRVVGAWLAEDNLSLTTDIYSQLPFVVHLAKLTDSSAAEKKGRDLLKFLLPGFSHLTAEDKPRKIMLKAGVWDLLQGHIQRKLQENFGSLEPVAERLRLCCEVMVNVCVCEHKPIKEGKEAAVTAALILEIFTKAPLSQPVLKMNALLLFTLIANRTGPDLISEHTGAPLIEALQSMLDYLISSLRSCPGLEQTADNPVSACWDSISELCLISMQELSRYAVWKAELVRTGMDHMYVKQLTTLLAKIGDNSKGNEYLESIVAAVCCFLDVMTQQ